MIPNSTIINQALRAAENPILLQTAVQLEQAAETWRLQAVLGMDTEFVRERTFRANLGLVQVSDGRTAWLIDPVATKTLVPLREILADRNVTKIFHSASEDLEVLLQTTGELPQPMIDTQIACAMLGQPLQMGYQQAAKWLLGVAIDKDQTRSNWCRRPLRPKQLRYAALDVVLLPLMLDKLKLALEEINRWEWLEEDVLRMQRRSQEPANPEQAYLRFAGIGRLEQVSLNILQALAEWREKIAIQRNRARGFVVADNTLMSIAQTRPESASELKAIEGIHPVAFDRYQDVILKIVTGAAHAQPRVERYDPLTNSDRRQLSLMRKLVIKQADELQVDPALLASKRELEKLIRALKSEKPVPDRFYGWRGEVIANKLLDILKQD
jgi:ribonuclease D